MSETPAADAPVLRHVTVVGGTPAEWVALGETGWTTRLEELGKVADHAGASWLTIRPLGAGGSAGGPGADGPVRELQAGGCTVVADPETDGRERLLRGMRTITTRGELITEARIDAEIEGASGVEPDLVLVLGRDDRLPESMVWELAYCELVYLDVDWADLQPEHLGQAIAAYAHRHRRFGGLD